MENFLHIAAIWTHILGIALFVGPQFFLALAWMPASRGITDLPTRARAMRTITTRFGWIGGAGLVLIVVAGTYLISTWRDYYTIADDTDFTSLRYGVLFIVKMTVLIVMLVFAGLHTFVIGPRLLRHVEAQAAGGRVDEAEGRRLRKLSMWLSIGALVLTLGIMVLGVSMSSTNYSFQDA